MPNTYSQLYIHIVFAVKHPKALIDSNLREELHKFIAGILTNKKHNVINYILNQQEHHRKKTFHYEYLEFLKLFEIDYDEKYLFEFFD